MGRRKERERERERDLRATDYGLLVAWRVLSWNQSTGHRFIFRSGYYFDRYTRVYIFEVRLLFFFFFLEQIWNRNMRIFDTRRFLISHEYFIIYTCWILRKSSLESFGRHFVFFFLEETRSDYIIQKVAKRLAALAGSSNLKLSQTSKIQRDSNELCKKRNPAPKNILWNLAS